MGNFRVVQVTYPVRNFVQLISKAAQSGPVFLFNSDAADTVYLTDSEVGNPSTVDAIPVPPLSGYGVDGNTDTYAFMMTPGQTADVSLMPGGTTFFQPPSLAGIGGARVFVQAATPPVTAPLNSIWFNTASGALETWNGTAWVARTFDAQQLIRVTSILASQIANNTITAAQVANSTLTSTQLAAAAGILGTQIASATITSGNIAANTIVAGNIAANTIIAANLAAGIVYAGIVDATTITGASLIADGTAGEVLVYSGAPSVGDLIASVSPVAGTDTFGNTVNQGVWSYIASPGSGSAGLDGANLTMGDGHSTWNIGPDFYTPASADYLTLVNAVTGAAVWIDANGSIHASAPGSFAPESWHPAALLNGWANAGGGLYGCQYTKLATNKVTLMGVINSAAMTNAQFMTLPLGYRPLNTGGDYGIGEHTSTALGTQGAFLRVSTTGACSIQNATTTTGAVAFNVDIPLDNI
jgi:hypothetical protein